MRDVAKLTVDEILAFITQFSRVGQSFRIDQTNSILIVNEKTVVGQRFFDHDRLVSSLHSMRQ